MLVNQLASRVKVLQCALALLTTARGSQQQTGAVDLTKACSIDIIFIMDNTSLLNVALTSIRDEDLFSGRA